MAAKEEKKQTVEEFKKNIEKMFGKDSDAIINDVTSLERERFSSGSYLLDDDLRGGWVKGTIIELFGTPGSGKTTLCIHAVAEHQKKYPDEPILWMDLEKVFDAEYFTNIGIDISPDKFILSQPSNGEKAWEVMISFVKNIAKGVIILDSVACLLSAKEDEGQVGDAQMASAARMNSQGLRKLMPHMGFEGTTVFVINQLRKNIGGYGNPNVTTGGEAWSYYARTRVESSFSKGEAGEYAIHKFKQIKSNYGKKDAITETSILYGEGFDKMKELLVLAVETGIVEKGGSWYSYGDTKLGQGADNVVYLLNDNPDLVQEIESKIKEKYDE